MANVSIRVDDSTKADAEKVADEIGIPLSTAINIFLKRFVANDGFPFSVVAPKKASSRPIIDKELLDASIKKAVADPNNIGLSHQFTYLDPETNELFTVQKE